MSLAVAAFIEALTSASAAMRMAPSVLVPESMRVPGGETEGWCAWRPVRRSAPVEFSKLERWLGAPLPPSYRELLSAVAWLELDFSLFSLNQAPLEGPLQSLEVALGAWSDAESPFAAGLIPVGRSRHSGGLVCFDSRGAAVEGEWPVVLWDVNASARGALLCSSFPALLEMVTRLLRGEPRTEAVRWLVETDVLGAGLERGFAHWNAQLDGALVPSAEMRIRWGAQNPANDLEAQRRLLANAEALMTERGNGSAALAMLARVTAPELREGRGRAEAEGLRLRALRGR